MALPKDSFRRAYNNFRMGANGNPIDAGFGLYNFVGRSSAGIARAGAEIRRESESRHAANAEMDLERIIKHIQRVAKIAGPSQFRRNIYDRLDAFDNQVSQSKMSRGQFFVKNKGAVASFLGDIGGLIEGGGSSFSGARGHMLTHFGRFLRSDAASAISTRGIGRAFNVANALDRQSYRWEGFEQLKDGSEKLVRWIEETVSALDDSNFADRIRAIGEELKSSMFDANSMEEQSAAIERAANAIKHESGTATGTDREKAKTLSDNMAAASDAAKKETETRKKGLPLSRRLQQGLLQTSRIMKGAFSASGPWISTAKATWDIGKQIHDFVEGVSSKQIGITSERARFGRYLYGTNINHGDLMGAVATGRRAGIADSEVMQMMGALGKQLASARWGEGGLIEKIGRWGGTPWNPNGTMMNAHQMQIQMSQMMNRMTDKEEKLQFLYDMGYGPEKFEYFENYARDAQRTEMMKRNKNLRGVLEDAQIFDESGMSRRVDAYTQLVLKRREIQKQNAYDKGLWSGLAEEYLNPEQWFFSKTSARLSGIAQAKGEEEMNKLTAAIKELIEVEKTRGKNGGGGNGGGGENGSASGGSPSFSSVQGSRDLTISLAERIGQDFKNRGEKSSIKFLTQQYLTARSALALQSAFKAENAEELEKINDEYGTSFTAEEIAEYKNSNLNKEEMKQKIGLSKLKKHLTEASRREGKTVEFDEKKWDNDVLKYLRSRYGDEEASIKMLQWTAGNQDIAKEVAGAKTLAGIDETKIKAIASDRQKLSQNKHGARYYEGESYAKSLKDVVGGEAEIKAVYEAAKAEQEDLQSRGKLGKSQQKRLDEVSKNVRIYEAALDFYKNGGDIGNATASGDAGTSDATGGSGKGQIGSVSDEGYTPMSNPFEEPDVDIDQENLVAESALNNREQIDFSDADALARQSQNAADASLKASENASKELGGTYFRTEDEKAMAADAKLEEARAKELARLGSTWFRKGGKRTLASGLFRATGKSSAAVNAMKAASIKAAEAAESGNIEQGKVESGVSAAEVTGAEKEGKGSSSSSNEVQMTNNITVNAENSEDGSEIADKIVSVVIPKICDAVMSATRTGDGIG